MYSETELEKAIEYLSYKDREIEIEHKFKVLAYCSIVQSIALIILGLTIILKAVL